MHDGVIRQVCAGFLMLVFTFCLSPGSAAALGFGKLMLNSHLNEPLNAEVPLLLGASEKPGQVRVELASENEYRQMGLNWQPDLERIRVTKPEQQANGAVIHLYSAAAIHAPILSIVLKATRAGRGTYFKQYRLLLDSVEAAAVTRREQQPTVLPLRPQAEAAALLPTTVATDDFWSRRLRYGPIRSGESLGRIAQRLRKDKRFNNRQVMLALYDKNRQAFTDGNINQLKEGAWLDVPVASVVSSYGNDAAMQRFSALLRQPVKLVEDEKQPMSAPAPREVPAAEPKQPPEALQYSGKISLNRGADKQGAASAPADAANDQLTSIHSELMAGKLQMSELGKSVAGLNSSVELIRQDMQKLKHDVTAIRNRPQAVPVEPTMNWQLAFYVLLAGVAGLLLGAMIMRRRLFARAGPAEQPAVPAASEKQPVTPAAVAKEQPVASAAAAGQPIAPTAAEEQPVAPPVAVEKQDVATLPAEKHAVDDELIQLLNKVEERIGRCDYEEAGRLLEAVSNRSPDSLRAAALRAQIYHETGRTEERDVLIDQISASSDKDAWQRFSQLLPSHVWNACFGDGVEHGSIQGKS